MYRVTDKILLTGTAVWPILLLINSMTALNDTHFSSPEPEPSAQR